MGKGTGKARHPHDADRPESAAVRRALAKQDVAALKLALTPRQRAFCHEYVVDFNGSAAAVRAGYSKPYADRQAHVLMKNEGVAFLIDHLVQSTASKISIVDKDYVIQRVCDIVNKDGAKDGDKLRGLELLARHLGLLTDKTEITGKDGGAIEIEQQNKEQADSFTQMLKQIQDRVDKEAGLKKDVTLLDDTKGAY